MQIAILKREKCQPKKCNDECIKYCPMVRTGKETIVLDNDGKPIISEELCAGCGICIKRCPFSAISIIGLPEELKGEETHRYGKNGFVLYGLPVPKEGEVIGIIGENGTGKSTTVKILAGMLNPNLGKEEEVGWTEIIKNYVGSELQSYLKKLFKGGLKVAYKPQYIDGIPKLFSGKVSDLLENIDNSKSSSLNHLIKVFEMEEAMEKNIKEISGGELQRVALIACMIRDANVYFFDEITPYLDIYQRVNVAKGIKEVLGEKTVIVVEHDLAILDMLADSVHITYGEPGAYGIITMPKATNKGINEYLDGILKAENIKIRDKPIKFSVHHPRERMEGSFLLEYGSFAKKYGEFTLHAARGKIQKGEVLGIVGRNAIGKSTFVKVLAGEIKPSEGKISLPVKISYKPQYIKGDIDKTVKEFFNEKKLNEADIVEILEPLRIEKIEEKQIKELSGGELQTVAIAACLCQDASLYIFDEPSAHLDVEQKIRVMKTLRRYVEKREASAMVVDHDIYLVDLLSDRLMVFNGEPSIRGEVESPFEMREGMNRFLKDLGISFRRDEASLRPRINKISSIKDRKQKEKGEYYYEF